MSKKKDKFKYVEPTDYIRKETRKKFGVGEYYTEEDNQTANDEANKKLKDDVKGEK